MCFFVVVSHEISRPVTSSGSKFSRHIFYEESETSPPPAPLFGLHRYRNSRGVAAAAAAAAVTQSSSNYRTLCWCRLHVSRKLVPYRRRACALTTAPTARRGGSSGNYRHQSETRAPPEDTHRASAPVQPSVLRGRVKNNNNNNNNNNQKRTFPPEKLGRRDKSREVMDERIPHLQDRQFMEHADFLG